MSLWRAYLTFIRDFMLSLPPQLRDWFQPKVSRKLRRGRRRVHCELGLVGFLWGRHFVPPLHEFPQTLVWFWSHLFYLFVWRVLHISDRRSRGLNTWIFISFFLGLDIKITSTPYVSSSLNWNLSISSSSEEKKHATLSLATATPRGTCWIGGAAKGTLCGIGWSIGGRSYGTKKWGRDTSIRANR